MSTNINTTITVSTKEDAKHGTPYSNALSLFEASRKVPQFLPELVHKYD